MGKQISKQNNSKLNITIVKENQEIDTFQQLDILSLIKMFSFLDFMDFNQFRKINKFWFLKINDHEFWQTLIQRVYPNVDYSIENIKEIYFKQSDKSLIRSSQDKNFGGAWTNDQNYYNRQFQDQDSLFGYCLQLKSVCWIEGVTNFTVQPGCYIPVWRFKINSSQKGIKQINFYTTYKQQLEDKHEIVNNQKIEFNMEKYAGKGWIFVTGIDVIKVESKNYFQEYSVEVKYFGQEPYWAHGFLFDYCGLLDVDVYSKHVNSEDRKQTAEQYRKFAEYHYKNQLKLKQYI